MYEKDTFIVVDAEFPWSLRNAVFMFDTMLSNTSSLQDIQNSLFRYIEQNLVLRDRKGEKLALLQVADQKGQSHHEEYQLTFENKPISSIRNTLLFNFSEKQKNFHVLDINGEKKEFVLTPTSPEIIFEAKNTFKYLFYFFGCLVLVFGYVLFLKFRVS